MARYIERRYTSPIDELPWDEPTEEAPMSRDLKGELLIAQKINDFVTFRSAPICDRCITGGLGLTTQAHAAQITATLGTTSDFKRKTGICSVCKNERIVIHATRT
jgi:hypothetical protein